MSRSVSACDSATASLVSIRLTPRAPSVTPGSTVAFTAIAACSDDSTQDVTTVAAWTSSDPTVATVGPSGLATALRSGTTVIAASVWATPFVPLSDSTTLTVRRLVSVAVAPVKPSVVVGDGVQFSALAAYDDGSSADVTVSASWVSSKTSVATVSASGFAVTLRTGNTKISASFGGVTGGTSLDVTGAPSASIVVTPSDPHVLRNGVIAFHAILGSKDISKSVSWSTSSPGVGTIQADGTAHAVALGSTSIKATFKNVSGATSLTVTTAAPPVFAVQPTDTDVDAVINGASGVIVSLADSLGAPLAGQTVVMSIGNDAGHGGRGTLTGTLTRLTDGSGAAAFDDLAIDWAGDGYTLSAAAQPISGAVATSSDPFDELRTGDPCLGPAPPCAGGCADTDGDGLSDAWETAGAIDVNGDGLITDAHHDLPLPDADPAKPDLYVWYDWMGSGRDDESCATSQQCEQLGAYHSGETCNADGQCVYTCVSDLDCTARFPGHAHAGERCVDSVCEHTHDPLVLEPRTFDLVASRFADHGIGLHVLRGVERPHSHVVSFRSDAELAISCEGASLASGTAGIGKLAVSLYDLKSSPDLLDVAYHYTLFSHLSGCDSLSHCPPSLTSTCPNRTLVFGQSGLAEISGNVFVISLGPAVNHSAISPHVIQPATFMHEVGHNLGLHHDGHLDRPCADQSDCDADETCSDYGDGRGLVCRQSQGEEPNYKPNYLSVMNYRYQRGIPVADAVGSSARLPCTADSECGGDGGTCSEGACVRLDFSRQTLPSGGNTPGSLDELDLSEPAGLGSFTADLFTFNNGICDVCDHAAPTTGPVDWSGAGSQFISFCNYTDTGIFANEHAQADVNRDICEPIDLLHGHTDWPDISGRPFSYRFACPSLPGPSANDRPRTLATSWRRAVRP